MSSHIKKLLSVTAVAGLVLAGSLSAEMLPQNKRAQVLYPTKMVVSRPLRDIPPPVVKATAAHEVANLALYLASDVSSHIMGSGIRMDAGMDALC